MNDDAAFKPGDVVGLNSGGPIMTIDTLFTNDFGEPSAICRWFSDYQSELRSQTFSLASLYNAGQSH